MRFITVRGHTFLDVIGAESNILDCSANLGEFATQMIARYGCRVCSVEPNPAMLARIPPNGRLTVLPSALAARTGEATLSIASDCEASTICNNQTISAEEQLKVATISLSDLLAKSQFDRVALAKFDIEGAETDVLNATHEDVLHKIDQFTIEFHDFCNLTPIAEIRSTLLRMRRLGFSIIRLTRHGHGDVLVINRERLRLSRAQEAKLKFLDRNIAGFHRILCRKFFRGI